MLMLAPLHSASHAASSSFDRVFRQYDVRRIPSTFKMRPILPHFYWGAIASLLFLQSLRARTCKTNNSHTDLGSMTLSAPIVFEGRAKHRIPDPVNSNLYRVEFKVQKILKGDHLLARKEKTRHLVAGTFGQTSEYSSSSSGDDCVAPPIGLEANYLVFVETRLENATHNKTTGNDRNSGSVFYRLSGFPEKVSGKAKKEVLSYACAGCGRSPQITKESKDKTEAIGRKLKLHCRASGKPPPSIEWFKDDLPLRIDSSRISVRQNSRDSRLQIKRLILRDNGTYRCQASNVLGKISSKIMTVTVIDKPHSVLCPYQGFCFNGGTCYEMMNLKDSKFCECTRNYIGKRCEEKKGITAVGKGIFHKRKKKRHLRQNNN